MQKLYFTKKIKPYLQILTNTKFTQTELGKALGKTRSDIHSKIKRNSELKLSEIQQIESYILNKYNLKIALQNSLSVFSMEQLLF